MFPILRYRFNYSNRMLRHEESGTAGVYLKNGDIKYVPWLGYIGLDEAKTLARINGAAPVKLLVDAYSNSDPFNDWQSLEPGQYIQGCLIIDSGVYAVILTALKIVNRPSDMKLNPLHKI